MVVNHFIDYVCMFVCVVTSVFGYLRMPEEASDLLVLELQEGVSCLTWLLGMKLLPLQEQQTHLQQGLLKSTLNSNTKTFFFFLFFKNILT